MAAKKISEEDIDRIYRKSYKIPFNWEDVLDSECLDFIDLFERATNSSKTLTLSALIPLVATICGPETMVESQKGAFKTPLNTFIFSICAPGGGKSITYDRVIAPVIEQYRQATGLTINLESYTAAGIHNHQIKNKGIGIITSDEGHRFLSSVQTKQKNGESERAFLCKVWGGKGDYATLSGGSRGFEKTSLSMCILIQPQPLLTELVNMQGADGFLDRFLFLSSRPCIQRTSVITEAYAIMRDNRMSDFVPVFDTLRLEHATGRTYILSEEAEQEYAILVDSFAEYLNRKYNMDSDDEDSTGMSTSGDNQTPVMPSSKDTQHILRLSAIMHILNHSIRRALGLCRGQIPIRIERKSIVRAKTIFHASAEQKNVFMQALQAIWSQETVKLPRIKTLRERLLKVVLTTPGPAMTLRNVCNRMKGSTSESVQEALRGLEKEGFGWLKVWGGRRKQIFAKIPPTQVTPKRTELERLGITTETYRTSYNDDTSMDYALKEIVYSVEFQEEIGYKNA